MKDFKKLLNCDQLGYSRKYPRTPMDDIGNPVRNAQWLWLEIHKYPQNFVNFNRKNHSNFCKVLEFLKILNK